ncbi:MAG: serine/threonine-protein kinase, partial [Candidatus Margulisiibacteriota bacterium]|nr:serine/threonine-protein kinase [Candidatus Margulisiibacteriota bacterium]
PAGYRRTEKRDAFIGKRREFEVKIEQARKLLSQGKGARVENLDVRELTVYHANRANPSGGSYEGKERYLIINKIGSGGMASVYSAYNLSRDRHEVLKIARPEYAENTEFRARFFKEAERLEFFHYPSKHPNVVRVYGSGEIDGTIFIAMEKIDGISLADVLGIAGRLPILEATRLMGVIAATFKDLHQGGIVHRDIKPENIMLQIGEKGKITVKIIDFGIAKDTSVVKTLTQAGTILGTPEYMPLEQLLGREIDHRTDLYSEGALFFEMLTGSCPIPRGKTESSTAYLMRAFERLTVGAVPDVATYLYDIDKKGLAGVIGQMKNIFFNTLGLQKDRYSDENVFIADLGRLEEVFIKYQDLKRSANTRT